MIKKKYNRFVNKLKQLNNKMTISPELYVIFSSVIIMFMMLVTSGQIGKFSNDFNNSFIVYEYLFKSVFVLYFAVAATFFVYLPETCLSIKFLKIHCCFWAIMICLSFVSPWYISYSKNQLENFQIILEENKKCPQYLVKDKYHQFKIVAGDKEFHISKEAMRENIEDLPRQVYCTFTKSTRQYNQKKCQCYVFCINDARTNDILGAIETTNPFKNLTMISLFLLSEGGEANFDFLVEIPRRYHKELCIIFNGDAVNDKIELN